MQFVSKGFSFVLKSSRIDQLLETCSRARHISKDLVLDYKKLYQLSPCPIVRECPLRQVTALPCGKNRNHQRETFICTSQGKHKHVRFKYDYEQSAGDQILLI